MSGINAVVFILLCSLAWAGFRFARWVYGDYFAPIGIFLGVNLTSLALNQLRLLPLVPLSTQVWFLVVVSLFSFVVGVFIATPSLVITGKRSSQRGFFDKKIPVASDGLSLFFYSTAILGIAGWAFFVTVVVPPGWLSNPWMLQGNYVFPYHLGYSLVAGTLAPAAFVLLTLTKRKIGFPAICLVVGNVLALAVCGIKSYLILSAIITFLVWSIVRQRRVRFRYLLAIAAILVGFMAIYDHFIDIFAPRRFVGSKFPAALAFLERPYLYAAGSWSAMTVVIESPPPQAHWGQVTLLPLWKLLGPGGLGLMERVPQYLTFVNIGPSKFNTYSLVGEVYWDFGWVGSILICFLLGFVSTRLYLIARKRRDWVLYLLSAIFSYGLFISFFAYYYRDTLIFLLLYAMVAGRGARRVSRVFRHFAYSIGRRRTTATAGALGESIR